MKKLLAKAVVQTKNALKNNKNYLRLKSIKKNDKTIFCEFNEILRLDGNLIKFDIKEIATNKNIQDSIAPETLFLIGTIYGQHLHHLKEFRIKTIDIANKSVTLENVDEKIVITIAELLLDKALIEQINPFDMVKLLCPYLYRIGYDAHLQIADKANETEVNQPDENKVINLFKNN